MYLPININLKNKTCLVVGAGKIALKKIKRLLNFDAKIKVIAPKQVREIKTLARKNKIKLYSRRFLPKDLKNVFLLILATENKTLNKKISIPAKKKNILVNVVDNAELCSFIMPAVIKRGNLVISISTSGAAPAFSAALREELKKIITPDFKNIVAALGRTRAKKKKDAGKCQ